MDVPPADHGFALFGPAFGVPLGGFCVSVFLLVRREGHVLAGQMADHAAWAREWQPNMAYYQGDRRAALFDGLRLPATYLREAEHPGDAARRVWRDQLGLPGAPALEAPAIVSEAGQSRRYPEHNHWDLVFVYEAEAPELPAHAPAHWASLDYHDPAGLAPEDFVMLHGELLEHL